MGRWPRSTCGSDADAPPPGTCILINESILAGRFLVCWQTHAALSHTRTITYPSPLLPCQLSICQLAKVSHSLMSHHQLTLPFQNYFRISDFSISGYFPLATRVVQCSIQCMSTWPQLLACNLAAAVSASKMKAYTGLNNKLYSSTPTNH